MSGALTIGEAFGPTLDEVILAALSRSQRPARSAICPVCSGTMRRLGEATSAVQPLNSLVCGECGSSLEDGEPAGQLRLVATPA
jgi:hypothetical protein